MLAFGSDPTARWVFAEDHAGAALWLPPGSGHRVSLESTSLGGTTLYARHGSEMLGTIHVDGSPLLWPMVRARGSGSATEARA